MPDSPEQLYTRLEEVTGFNMPVLIHTIKKRTEEYEAAAAELDYLKMMEPSVLAEQMEQERVRLLREQERPTEYRLKAAARATLAYRNHVKAMHEAAKDVGRKKAAMWEVRNQFDGFRSALAFARVERAAEPYMT